MRHRRSGGIRCSVDCPYDADGIHAPIRIELHPKNDCSGTRTWRIGGDDSFRPLRLRPQRIDVQWALLCLGAGEVRIDSDNQKGGDSRYAIARQTHLYL